MSNLIEPEEGIVYILTRRESDGPSMIVGVYYDIYKLFMSLRAITMGKAMDITASLKKMPHKPVEFYLTDGPHSSQKLPATYTIERRQVL